MMLLSLLLGSKRHHHHHRGDQRHHREIEIENEKEIMSLIVLVRAWCEIYA